MIFKGDESTSQQFVSLPESGLGYQVIDATIEKYRNRRRFIVYNSSLIVTFDNSFSDSKEKIQAEGFESILAKSPAINLSKIALVNNTEFTSSNNIVEDKSYDKGRHSGENGAKENPKEKADGNEIFVRLSAYENDRRIDLINKRLLPGTYSTTLNDYVMCYTFADDPIDRYALPNDEQIKWSFFVRPKEDDILQRGIVQPAFGHDGGGIETYFEYGTSNNTYLTRHQYGRPRTA